MSAYTDRLKKEDPLKLKAQRLRANMRKRSPLPVPPASELEAWLKAQPMVCAYSGARITNSVLEVDHRQPLDRGGTNDLTNLAVVHAKANAAKGSMTEAEFRALIDLTADWDDGGAKLFTRLRMANSAFVR